MFTAAELFAEAAVEAPEILTRPVPGQVMASAFNAALRDLVLEVVDADSERLAERIPVPAAVVAQDPIDLTDDGTGTKKRAWLHIDYIDWLGADGEGREVWIVTQEARNRWDDTAEDEVVGFLEGQKRQLRKIGSWSGVSSLVVYGVLAPTKVKPETLGTPYDYPPALEAALKWELLAQLAGLIGADRDRLAKWDLRRQEARERLFNDAETHVGSQIEEIPLQWGAR